MGREEYQVVGNLIHSCLKEEEREERNRHREVLGEMVDQLTIDHDAPDNQDAAPPAAPSLPPSGARGEGGSSVGEGIAGREEGPHRPLHFLPSNRLYQRLNRYR